MTDASALEKRRQLQVMLDAGLVMLHLDPRVAGVVVPSQFADDPVLRLNLAWGFNLPALDIGEDGVYAVLSFSRQNFGCTVPWASVFAMTAPDAGHEGVVWPESVPPELAPHFQAAGATRGAVPVSLRAEPERPSRRTQPLPVPQPLPATQAAHATDLPTPAPRPRPVLVALEGGASRGEAATDAPATDAAATDAPATDAPPAKRPSLRLVKD